ncbi:hypothetical protein BMETH_3119_0 [methanotrophic bacterial endosymbiont of Bathymodiolus sp.]|nr:hypothetical protein BMETH_3119_0 [methanotrophic bacterial endosymbiont of Bathymodiolus sp.]
MLLYYRVLIYWSGLKFSGKLLFYLSVVALIHQLFQFRDIFC